MARQTPPMSISGAFLLRTPFTTDPNKSYTVVAIRTFNELLARSQDPLRLVYQPVGLDETAFAEDQLEGALVICLRDSTGSLIYVPDTYIDQFPSMGSVQYSRLIAAVSLGMWPDYRDLSDIEEAIKVAVETKIGVEPQIFLTRAATNTYMTEQQHIQLTLARTANVTVHETPTAMIRRLTAEVERLQMLNDEQERVIEALANNANPQV